MQPGAKTPAEVVKAATESVRVFKDGVVTQIRDAGPGLKPDDVKVPMSADGQV
jgi:hypothetical protein